MPISKDTIGVGSLKETLAAAQKTFTLWAGKQSGERKTKDLLEKLSSAFFKLLDELTIARSRPLVLLASFFNDGKRWIVR